MLEKIKERNIFINNCRQLERYENLLDDVFASQMIGSATEVISHFLKFVDNSEEKDVVDVDNVRKVIFNPPATIVIFNDGSKIVVKTTDEDEYQPEIGFAMAMMKEIFGSRGAYKKWIAQWLPKEEDNQQESDIVILSMLESLEKIGKQNTAQRV